MGDMINSVKAFFGKKKEDVKAKHDKEIAKAKKKITQIREAYGGDQEKTGDGRSAMVKVNDLRRRYRKKYDEVGDWIDQHGH